MSDKIEYVGKNSLQKTVENIRDKVEEHAINYSLDDTGNGLNIDGGFTPKSHDYSTDEKVVGTWIDGKPIYEKVINKELSNLPDPRWIDIDCGIECDYTCIKNSYMYLKSTNISICGTNVIYDSQGNNMWFGFHTDKRTIKGYRSMSRAWEGSGSIEGWTLYLILQYTKATD